MFTRSLGLLLQAQSTGRCGGSEVPECIHANMLIPSLRSLVFFFFSD